MSTRNQKPTVVIAGGGVAALEALLALRALAGPELDVELVSAEPHFWYRALAVGEPFGLGTVPRFSLAELARDANADSRIGTVTEVDAAERSIRLAGGAELAYDAFLLATGTAAVPAVPGALTFRGPADAEAFEAVLRDADAGGADHIVFAIPASVAWQLPLYELALLTDAWLRERSARGRVLLTLVTPEDRPLQSFGVQGSEAVAELLREREIELRTGTYPDVFADGLLTLFPRASIAASHVVALPRLEGRPPAGVPRDAHGFVPVDAWCRVRGLEGVYAAGDVTTIPLKQGGLAAQQADAAAAAIAAGFGLADRGAPFRPVLRGLLLTGGVPRYLRSDLAAGTASVGIDPLWWPPAKVVGKHLAPYLARRTGVSLEAPARGDVVPVEVALGS